MKECKAIIHKLSSAVHGMNYDVSLWHKFGNTFVYAGYGKYFQTAEDAEQFATENANAGIVKDY